MEVRVARLVKSIASLRFHQSLLGIVCIAVDRFLMGPSTCSTLDDPYHLN
ncbi:MAG: hypothetical protein JWO31_1804 [Phycisphaerales bacterium]|nr:hypothetical protein [Phycisphaerales bacterium]